MVDTSLNINQFNYNQRVLKRTEWYEAFYGCEMCFCLLSYSIFLSYFWKVKPATAGSQGLTYSFKEHRNYTTGHIYVSTRVPCLALERAYFKLCKAFLYILSSVLLHLEALRSWSFVIAVLRLTEHSINDFPEAVTFKVSSHFKVV